LDIWPDTLHAVGAIKNTHVLNFIELIVKTLYRNFDHILVGSKSFVSIVEKRDKKVPVSYFNNCAEDVFTEGKIIVPKKEFSFKKDGFKIMFAGNMGEAQDIKNVFEAAKLLKNQNVTWMFVGDGRMKKWLEDQFENHNMKDKVEFYGNNPIIYMPFFFSKADVMLVSLKNEDIFRKTVPAKLQAYMSFQKPVLGMLSGEGAEIIKESDCGWVCGSGDYENLANIIQKIKNQNKDELIAKGNNGKSYYNNLFQKKVRFDQLFQLFQ
jgi:glycosyltransferase involved in cell wall biosynthesis